MELHHKIAVVTGASSGVGRALVRALASEGAKIGLIARNRDGLEAAAREVRELGSAALVRLQADATELPGQRHRRTAGYQSFTRQLVRPRNRLGSAC